MLGYKSVHPTVQDGMTSATTAAKNYIRVAQIARDTDGAGACAAALLHTAVGAYYPVVRLKRITSSVADAATELLITTAGGGALLGPASKIIALVAGVTLEIDTLLYNLTDTTSISLAIQAGPLNSTIWLEYEYWSET